MNEDNKSIAQQDFTDRMPISVRAYVHAAEANSAREPRQWLAPSDELLIFDTETTVDEAQQLRIGTYQYRIGGALDEHGIFYDPAAVTPDELSTLNDYTTTHNLKLMTRGEFVDRVFYGRAYDYGATIVGFNLPFDLSRIAVGHGPARRKMRGGFSLKLIENTWRPRVQVKHLSQRTSLISFSSTSKQTTPRGMRKRGLKAALAPQGYFVDVKALAGALLSEPFSLERLGHVLKLPHPKLEAENHGAPIDNAYITYALRDTQASWECYQELVRRYSAFGLSTRTDQIYSEASVGKAYLTEMGVQPWRKLQPEFPPKLLGYIMSAYYGGRSEVRIRRKVVQVLYCDFVSMYPTVCALMGLWRFVVAEGMTHRDSTTEVRDLLARITLADLQNPTLWRQLNAIVRLTPASTLVPIRGKYDGSAQATIGLNYLSSEQPLWYTLADLIASKLLTGKTPEIEHAITFEPGTPQPALRSVAISGNPEYMVCPAKDDFYRRLIDLRRSVKARMEHIGEHSDAWAQLDHEQQALKIAANATSYGIFVEVNVNEAEKMRTMICEGPRGVPFEAETAKIEEPGKYFHPILATLITGAARLMLGIVERLTIDHGVDWAMCDTDSMAIAKPNGMCVPTFIERATEVCSWFDALNPYEAKGPILKIEDANYDISEGPKRLIPLYCFAVSAKRYALFNVDGNGTPVLRKASAHGLGHLHAPYGAKTPAEGMPAPTLSLRKLGVELWQHDLWFQIVSAALQGEPDRPKLNFHHSLDLPAISRYAATTPDVLRWFDKHNRNRPYLRQVRPFGFLVSLFTAAWNAAPDQTAMDGDTDRRKRAKQVRPVAPFTRDPLRASQTAFDREGATPVPRKALKSYRQLLAQYHLHPEGKFLNADYTDTGSTHRRHVFATTIRHIGKEANKWERQFYTGLDEDADVDYGSAPIDPEATVREVKCVVDRLGLRAFARASGLSERHLFGVLRGQRPLSADCAQNLLSAARSMELTAP